MRREHVRDLLEQVAGGDARRLASARRAGGRAGQSRSASRRSTIIARCGRDFPKSSTARGRRRADRARSPTRIVARGDGVLVTRSPPTPPSSLRASIAGRRAERARRARRISPARRPGAAGKGTVAVVTAGTSDLPVAEEAAVTLRALGDCVTRVTDVGVAGIHRVLAQARRADDGRGRDRHRGHGRRAAVGGRRAGARAGDRRADERRIWRVVRRASRRC